MGEDIQGSKAVDGYIAGFEEPVRGLLVAMRETIGRALPEAREAIKYGIPTYVAGENIVHFAGFARHIGFYPGPSGIIAFAGDFAGYKSAKGSVQFPIDAPLPLELVERVALFRMREARDRGRGTE